MRPFMFSQALSSGAISVSPRVPALDADRAPVRAMMSRLRIDKSGMALVETALVAPFLAMIIMGKLPEEVTQKDLADLHA